MERLDAIEVEVLFFAVLRERRGVDVERIRTRPGITVAELYHELFPPGPQGALPVAFAVNDAYAPGSEVLHDGARVVFLPPLGGG